MALAGRFYRSTCTTLFRPAFAFQALLKTGCCTNPLKQSTRRFVPSAAELVILQGAAEKSIADLVAETGAAALYWNRRYGPGEIAIDTAIKKNMGEAGLDVRSFQGSLLHEPSQLRTGAGEPYRVYSPFWRALEKTGEPRTPFAAPESLPMFEGAPQGVALASLGLLPENEMVNGGNWTHGLQQAWPVGEAGARQCLVEFIDNGLHGYADGRDLPARRNVSRLSPYLRFGLISPWQAWHAARSAQAAGTAPARDVEKFLKELGWREFSYHLLYHYPSLTHENFNARFDDFPWPQSGNARCLEARTDRISHRRRRHARTLADRLHAQSDPNGCRLVSGQASAD